MKEYRVVVEDGLRYTMYVGNPEITLDRVKALPWRQAINWQAAALSVEIDVSENGGPWNFLKRVTGQPVAESDYAVMVRDAVSLSGYVPCKPDPFPCPDKSVFVYDAEPTDYAHNWPEGAPMPGCADALTRVVVDEGPGRNRYVFTDYHRDVTINELWVSFSKKFGTPDTIKLDAVGTAVTVEVREFPDHVWASYRLLKAPGSYPMFDDVMARRPYTFDPEKIAAHFDARVNRERMKTDPVIAGVFADPGSFDDPPPCSDGRASAGDCLRLKAGDAQMNAARLFALAEVADKLTPGSPAEVALWQLLNQK